MEISVWQDARVRRPKAFQRYNADLIRARRDDQGWSQEALGERARTPRINKETINRIENGDNTSIDNLLAVADCLNITAAELFIGRDLLRHGRTTQDEPSKKGGTTNVDPVSSLAERNAVAIALVRSLHAEIAQAFTEIIVAISGIEDPDVEDSQAIRRSRGGASNR